jgi:HK97 family phage major capsid protein
MTEELVTRYAPGSRHQRALTIERTGIDLEARTAALAFASEAPYERSWGIEVLDLGAKSIRMGRLKNGGPLLMDHDSRDQVGVIESVQIGADRVGRAVVRFGKSARAEEVFADVADGIRRNVSVGYVIHAAQLESEAEGIGTYRVIDWEPFELSLVAVPADATVGVGRSATEQTNQSLEVIMTEQIIDVRAEQQRGTEAERKRVADIISIGEQFKRYNADQLAPEAIRAGDSVDTFRSAILAKVSATPLPTSDIGLTRKEQQAYSFVRVLHALANPRDAKAQDAAGFELEASRAAAEAAGRASRGVMIPSDILRRDLVVGTTTAGGHTVATDLLAADFITLLRNSMVVMGLGTRMLTGLQGSVAIPRHTGAATAYWVAESGAPTESQQAFDQVTMQPRTVGAFSDISRKLLLQSSIDVESFVRQDLATVLGQEIQRVAINGSGTAPEPRGILNVSGIGSIAGGTNGLAPSWAHMVGLETEVAIDNADVGSLAYLTNAKIRGKLKTTYKDTGSGLSVWADGNTPLNGYQAAVTNAVPSNLTKGTSSGVCSAVIMGNFADLIIGMWGGLDLMADPYTGSTSGTVRIVALQDVDVAVRHAESFAAMVDALTV